MYRCSTCDGVRSMLDQVEVPWTETEDVTVMICASCHRAMQEFHVKTAKDARLVFDRWPDHAD